VNPHDVRITDDVANRIDEEVNRALKHHSDRVTRVEVHLQDENGPKGGQDKRCLMEARLAGDDPVTVEDETDDVYALIKQTAHKLERAVKHRIDKKQDPRAS
jgi:ribosomal subunit interface protein